MKTFSPKEKEIIRYIVDFRNSTTFVLANVFNKWFDNSGVSFDLETGEIKYDISDENIVDVDRILRDEHGIIEIALLIKYLIDNQYIYIIKAQENSIPLSKLGWNLSKTNIIHELPDGIISIIKQTLYRVFVSLDLQELVLYDFKSKEILQLEHAQKHLEQAQKQLSLSEEQLSEVKLQTQELQDQTKYVQAQLENAGEQTNEAKKQSKSAKCQTNLAWGALVLAGLTFGATVVIPIVLDDRHTEDKYRDDILLQLSKTNEMGIELNNELNDSLDSIMDIGNQLIQQNERVIREANRIETM